MDARDEFDAVTQGLRASMRRFPGCRVASCDCNEHDGEWKPGCTCPGHWDELNKAFGGVAGDWSFADAVASAKVGKPVRAAEEDAGVKEQSEAIPDYMICPQCGRQLIGVEYDWRDPEHYDGVSEWACFPCGYHRGRWSGKILEEGEKEPKYGRARAPAD